MLITNKTSKVKKLKKKVVAFKSSYSYSLEFEALRGHVDGQFKKRLKMSKTWLFSILCNHLPCTELHYPQYNFTPKTSQTRLCLLSVSQLTEACEKVLGSRTLQEELSSQRQKQELSLLWPQFPIDIFLKIFLSVLLFILCFCDCPCGKTTLKCC